MKQRLGWSNKKCRVSYSLEALRTHFFMMNLEASQNNKEPALDELTMLIEGFSLKGVRTAQPGEEAGLQYWLRRWLETKSPGARITHKCSVASQDEECHENNHWICSLERDHGLIHEGHAAVRVCRDDLECGEPAREHELDHNQMFVSRICTRQATRDNAARR